MKGRTGLVAVVTKGRQAPFSRARDSPPLSDDGPRSDASASVRPNVSPAVGTNRHGLKDRLASVSGTERSTSENGRVSGSVRVAKVRMHGGTLLR